MNNDKQFIKIVPNIEEDDDTVKPELEREIRRNFNQEPVLMGNGYKMFIGIIDDKNDNDYVHVYKLDGVTRLINTYDKHGEIAKTVKIHSLYPCGCPKKKQTIHYLRGDPIFNGNIYLKEENCGRILENLKIQN